MLCHHTRFMHSDYWYVMSWFKLSMIVYTPADELYIYTGIALPVLRGMPGNEPAIELRNLRLLWPIHVQIVSAYELTV